MIKKLLPAIAVLLLLLSLPGIANSPAAHAEASEPQTVEEAVAQAVAQMNAAGITGEYSQALWLHNWLIDRANYDYTLTHYQADGVLLRRTGVCQSYTLAYQLLLNAVGIENRIVVSPEMEHEWSLVRLEGIWCHIDCTWDDPGEGGRENQFYFGMSDALISRDHRWSAADYPQSPSPANYYPLRSGCITFATEEEFRQKAGAAAENQQETLKLCYVGTDPEFVLIDAFNDWFRSVNWKYGMRGNTGSFNQFFGTFSIAYTTPWQEPVTRLENPVPAPAFSLNSPRGVYRLSSYENNSVLLIFGRYGCSNTAGLLSRLGGELGSLYGNGIEVLVSVDGASSPEDTAPLEEAYPGFHYVYEQGNLMWRYLQAVNYDTSGGVTYPCVFIVNASGQIIYYSTGYVSNADELISEAVSTATGNALPAPSPIDYDEMENGSGNIGGISGSAIVSAVQSALQDGSSVVCYVDYSFDGAYLQKWESSYSLFQALGIKLVASFLIADEADKANYPNVIFADFDEDDFWRLLHSTNFSQSSASYTCSYLFAPDGSCVAYANGDRLSLSVCAVLAANRVDWDLKIPEALTEIHQRAFAGTAFVHADLTCGQLTSIQSLAFSDCPALRIVRIPDSVTDIAEDAFSGCGSVVFICSPDSYACGYAIRHGIKYLTK